MRGKRLSTAVFLLSLVTGWAALCVHPLTFNHGGVDVEVSGLGAVIWVRDEAPSLLIIPFWPLVLLMVLAVLLCWPIRSWRTSRQSRARGFEMRAVGSPAAQGTPKDARSVIGAKNNGHR